MVPDDFFFFKEAILAKCLLEVQPGCGGARDGAGAYPGGHWLGVPWICTGWGAWAGAVGALGSSLRGLGPGQVAAVLGGG